MIAVAELASCAGYRVEMHDGRIGSVAAVLPRAARAPSGSLLVHTGGKSCTLSAVPLERVETIDREQRRVVLRDHGRRRPSTRT